MIGAMEHFPRRLDADGELTLRFPVSRVPEVIPSLLSIALFVGATV